MANAWKAMGPSLFAGDERINAMLSNMAIEQVNDLTYCFPVENPIQLDMMQGLKPQILRFLKERLHNGSVDLQFRVIDRPVGMKAYTAEEKLRVLQQLNPKLDELRQTLHLSLG